MACSGFSRIASFVGGRRGDDDGDGDDVGGDGGDGDDDGGVHGDCVGSANSDGGDDVLPALRST